MTLNPPFSGSADTGTAAGPDAPPVRMRRVLGLPALVFFGLAYMVPLTVWTTYGVVTTLTGGHLPAAYVVTTAAMLLTALSYGRMVAVYPNAGSAYAYTAQDADGQPLDGSQSYTLRIPANPPAKNFWAVDVYDTQTRSLLQSTDYPAVASLGGTVQAEDDGSFLVHFGPTAPEGRESNWVPTLPGKAWFPIVRLYGPLEPWFDQTWKLPEIERVR